MDDRIPNMRSWSNLQLAEDEIYATHAAQLIVMPDAPYLQEKEERGWWVFSSALFPSLAANCHLLNPSLVQVPPEVVA